MTACGITWEALLYVQTVFIVCNQVVFTRRYGTTMDLQNPWHGLTHWWVAEFFLCRGVAQKYFTVPGIVMDEVVGGATSSYTRIMQLATTQSELLISACEKFNLELPPLSEILLQSSTLDEEVEEEDLSDDGHGGSDEPHVPASAPRNESPRRASKRGVS